MSKELSEEEVQRILQNWNTVAEALKTATRTVVDQLLEEELLGQRRPYIVSRLFTRKSRLQLEEDREELLGSLKGDKK